MIGNLPQGFPTEPVVFNRASDNRIQILVPKEYQFMNVDVGFNNALSNKLGPINTRESADGFFIELETYINNYTEIKNSLGITNGYFNVLETGTSLQNWNTIKQIVFKSSIPVEPELRSGQSVVRDAILTDFNITGVIDNTPISFFPEGPLRKYNLVSQDPLYTVDLKVFYRDIDGQDYPWLVHADDVVSVKLRFDITN
jgi:hypothetical protein